MFFIIAQEVVINWEEFRDLDKIAREWYISRESLHHCKYCGLVVLGVATSKNLENFLDFLLKDGYIEEIYDLSLNLQDVDGSWIHEHCLEKSKQITRIHRE